MREVRKHRAITRVHGDSQKLALPLEGVKRQVALRGATEGMWMGGMTL